MEGDAGDEFGEDDGIALAIIYAAVAGGLRYWARRESRAKVGGLIRDADAYSAAAAALVNDWITRQPATATGRPASRKG